MKNSIQLLLGIIVFMSCDKIEHTDNFDEVCLYRSEIFSPSGFEVDSIGEINFNGNVQSFQFLDEKIGYAVLTNNAGGYVEVFKTIDGGQSWSNLQIGIRQHPRGMVFKNEISGIITVQDVTGCPPPNCLYKCVVLKTDNGGLDWEEIEYEELKGILYNPKYDNEGNLYASLFFDGQSTLMKSVDNGDHWEILLSSEGLGFSSAISGIFQDKIFLSPLEGKMLVIDKNGQLIKTIEVENSSIRDLEIVDENNLIVVLSGKVIKTINGGDTWQTIYEESARMIGFDSTEKGLMLLEKSYCPSDVYQANDLIASTNNGGLNWIEAEETTTNLRINFTKSQRIGLGIWYMMIGNKLIEIKEN